MIAGPWKGVRDTIEPFDDSTDYFVTASNIYIPDPDGGSAAYARAGFTLANGGAPVYTGQGQCVYTHLGLDGTVYPFIVAGGHVYRANIGLTQFTDVTPAGVTIDPTARVKMVSLDGQLIVSDQTNPPWVGGNLGATPITATKIDYDGSGTAWSAWDITVWSGGLVVILSKVGGVYRQSDISWSEPGQPTVGWQQLNYDNNWTLEQTGSEPLYAIVGTNVALYYFRQRAVGAISGSLGPNLATTSTHDAISFNVGTRSPQSIQTFGNFIYFVDAMGRPWRLQLGAPPEAIWLNMRAVVDAQPTTYPAQNQHFTVSGFETEFNLYLVAPWSANNAQGLPPTQMYQFDCRSGRYVGRWNIKGPSGTGLDAMGTLIDGAGAAHLTILGSKDVVPAASGYVWGLNTVTAASTVHLVVEGTQPPTLTTEGGALLTSEGQQLNWTDDGFSPDIWIVTSRLGYSGDVMWNVDRCTIVTGSPDPCLVTVMSSSTPSQAVGVPLPGLSADQTYRLVVGMQTAGRGTQVQVTPLSITTQWQIDQVAITAVASQARPEDA